MQILFPDNALSSVILAKKISNKSDIKINLVASSVKIPAGKFIQLSSFTEITKYELINCLKISKFGRIGLIHERQNPITINPQEQEFTSAYTQKNKRANDKPAITIFPSQIITEMAKEGLADSVEFRRLARKYIKQVKHSNCDTLLWTDMIMGEEKTAKILQYLCGSQLKCIFLGDNTNPENILSFCDKSKIPAGKFISEITIKIPDEENEFMKTRIEKILKTKLSKDWLS